MLECMMHDPSYVSGMLKLEDQGLGVGWVAHQGLIFRLYAGMERKWRHLPHLLGRGTFLCGYNAKNLVKRYEELGGKFFESLNGIFSGLILDLRNNEVVLFNDRYGLNRIYYHADKERFYLASEAKCLLKILPLRQLNCTSLSELFSCGCTLQNRSLFEGVNILPGASKWTFQRQQPVKKESYFDHKDWENQPPLSVADYYDNLKGDIRAHPSALSSRRSPDRIVAHRRPRQSDDPRLRRCATFNTSLLYLRRHVSRVRRCSTGEKTCPGYQPTSRDNLGYAHFLFRISRACEEKHLLLRWSNGCYRRSRVVREPNRAADSAGATDRQLRQRDIAGNVAFKPGSLSDSLFSPDVSRFLENRG